MRLLLAFISSLLLGGCQLFSEAPVAPADEVRLQGQLRLQDGQWLLRPCGEARLFQLDSRQLPGFNQELQRLAEDAGPVLFADLAGYLQAAAQQDGLLQLTQRWRLQGEGPACNDVAFSRLLLRATGNEPAWSIQLGQRGLLLSRPGQPALALPYIEEQLPDGRLQVSSQADGEDIQLWLVSARCVDSMTGAISHLRAELRLNGQRHTGCAYFGGARQAR